MLLLTSLSAAAQEGIGMATGNYASINAVWCYPASIVDLHDIKPQNLFTNVEDNALMDNRSRRGFHSRLQDLALRRSGR